MSRLFIKHMVCRRCKLVVKSELEKLGLTLLSVDLGEVALMEPITNAQRLEVAKQLKLFGFELMDDKKSKVIDKIKTLLIDLVHHQPRQLKTNLSTYLSSQLMQDYSTLSNLFSEVEATTIETFFIHQKIERVKELLLYDELTLSEIAFQMNYSSVGYLSNQFKKVTGFSPSYYKKLKDKKRRHLEDL